MRVRNRSGRAAVSPSPGEFAARQLQAQRPQMGHRRRVAEAAEGHLQRPRANARSAGHAASPMALIAFSSMNRSARRTEAGAIQVSAASRARDNCAAARPAGRLLASRRRGPERAGDRAPTIRRGDRRRARRALRHPPDRVATAFDLKVLLLNFGHPATRRWGPHQKLESRPNLQFNGFSKGL